MALTEAELREVRAALHESVDLWFDQVIPKLLGNLAGLAQVDGDSFERRRLAQLLAYVERHQPVVLYNNLTLRAREYGFSKFPNRAFYSEKTPNGALRKVTLEDGTVAVELTAAGGRRLEELRRHLPTQDEGQH